MDGGRPKHQLRAFRGARTRENTIINRVRSMPRAAGRFSSASGRLPIRHGVGGFSIKPIHPFTHLLLLPARNSWRLVLDTQQWHGARQPIWQDKAPPRAPRQTTRETRRIHARKKCPAVQSFVSALRIATACRAVRRCHLRKVRMSSKSVFNAGRACISFIVRIERAICESAGAEDVSLSQSFGVVNRRSAGQW